MRDEDRQFADRLRARFVSGLRSALAGAKTCGLADFPRHLNVGDSAIWVGQRDALDEIGVPVDAANDAETHSQDGGHFSRALGERSPICFSGGGNFGDLYPLHHQLREVILDRYLDRPFIQLPASINFSDPMVLDRSRRLISRHGQVTICVRDRMSQAFAEEHFEARVLLMPDGAFGSGALPRPGGPEGPLVTLLRTDGEREAALGSRGDDDDWLHLRTRTMRWTHAGHEIAMGLAAGRLSGGQPLFPSLALTAYDRFAAWNVRRGTKQLSRGSVVITDRLHGHILCVLMGLPHVVLNDRNGKVRSFWDAWSSEAPCAHWADDFGTAREMSRSLLS